MDLQKLLAFAVENDASDIHLQSLAPPRLRIGGEMRAIDGPPLTPETMLEFIGEMAPPHMKDGVAEAVVQGMDFSYGIPDVCRFRCSAYSHLGQPGLVMRLIRPGIRTIEELNLPKVVHDIALCRRGLTLVTGTTGSGKSTTLAAMIDLINRNVRAKIITIEDPVEYLHTSQKALVSQLELGSDTPSFDQALRQALRQDPDVVLVGEMRDVETLRMALRAADTGHQVFSTVHSSNAAQTVERIIAMFPPAEHKLLLMQLAASLEAIISQRLIATQQGQRRPAIEILRTTPVTRKLILENRVNELGDYIAQGESGMQTFDQHLLRMHKEKAIRSTEALRWATNPEALSLALRGIATLAKG